MNNFAFVFARGGSKGLPGKNLRELAGKPLVQYSIDTALECPAISRVFVSTDDEGIADVARGRAVDVIDRPPDLAGDRSPEWLAWQHAIAWARDRYGDFDCFVSLPPTSPLRSTGDVEAAILQLGDSGADICIGVTPASRNPYFNMVKRDEENRVELVCQPDQSVGRRQDAPAVFDITTTVYAALPGFVMRCAGIFEGNVTSIEVPKERAVDIDDIHDFRLAEVIQRED